MEWLKSFLQIKKIIALLLTIVFCVLALKNCISSTEFLTVFTTIIGYYYGQSSVRQVQIQNKENKNK